MHKSAHQAALDQAQLLASYLAETPTASLDLPFIRRHLDALDSFAQAARTDKAVVHWSNLRSETPSKESDPIATD